MEIDKTTHFTLQSTPGGKWGEGIRVHATISSFHLDGRKAVKLAIEDDIPGHLRYFSAFLSPRQAAEIAAALMDRAATLITEGNVVEDFEDDG